MLQQYFRAKEEHPGVLLAMRVGDFYEFYGDDAETAATALEITLTGREDGGNRIAMAGVPFHSVEKYLARLLQKGLKVALCDQLEDPKAAKGLVKRGVTRVLTPGTLMEDSMLSAGQSSFLAALCVQEGRAGLAILEPSTGEFTVTELSGEGIQERLLQELARVRPAELLVGAQGEDYGALARESLGATVTDLASPSLDRATRRLLDQFHVANLQGFGCDDKPSAIVAASMILAYAEKNRLPLSHVDSISTYSVDAYMRLDPATRRSLELSQNMADGSKKYTLLEVLDQTVTSMGSRLMRRWIEQPLLDLGAIHSRQDAVERLVGHALVRSDIREGLKKLSDMERLVSRVSTGLAGPRDLAALRTTLLALPHLAEPFRKIGVGRLEELRSQISDHHDLAHLLDSAVVAEPPHALRDGGVIKEGFDLELDKLRDLSKNGKSYIASLEQAERESTGISNLKVGFNSVFGYYLEVSKSNLDKVPGHYIRKQTTANAERYITAELKEHESLVLGAQEKAVALESELFQRLRQRIAEHTRALLQTARALAEYDVLASLAEVASRSGYVKPEIVAQDVLELESGRHPVVEAQSSGFVPNDLHIDATEGGTRSRMLILTGPNMAGKSTYLRQAALIVLMAQIGSFVPAKSCRIGLCDRIFARIGAKDELALGQSTFMVEMIESANILNHASDRSLVILDEVGRGTSTYDGLAIAWAMVEHLVEIGSKTMFATHYHQLNALADQMPGVANYRVAVEEFGDDIVWTHKVLPGGTDRSYGIHVARMAGVPSSVLGRATEILAELEEKSEAPKAIPASTQRLQLSLFEVEEPPVVKALQKLDVNQLTPLEALRLLDEWKRKFGGK
ncbi:MAG: DNA mismatch repair protein MutS [Armatimonadetes bacterium 55-13]|nr:DNA mismatch repair protein MutS [Armatimonadota bacterium]OJU62745.1 MAG: DNA mismatch repair protein MutS [Armatimonadetes bacterium 55-13]